MAPSRRKSPAVAKPTRRNLLARVEIPARAASARNVRAGNRKSSMNRALSNPETGNGLRDPPKSVEPRRTRTGGDKAAAKPVTRSARKSQEAQQELNGTQVDDGNDGTSSELSSIADNDLVMLAEDVGLTGPVEGTNIQVQTQDQETGDPAPVGESQVRNQISDRAPTGKARKSDLQNSEDGMDPTSQSDGGRGRATEQTNRNALLQLESYNSSEDDQSEDELGSASARANEPQGRKLRRNRDPISRSEMKSLGLDVGPRPSLTETISGPPSSEAAVEDNAKHLQEASAVEKLQQLSTAEGTQEPRRLREAATRTAPEIVNVATHDETTATAHDREDTPEEMSLVQNFASPSQYAQEQVFGDVQMVDSPANEIVDPNIGPSDAPVTTILKSIEFLLHDPRTESELATTAQTYSPFYHPVPPQSYGHVVADESIPPSSILPMANPTALSRTTPITFIPHTSTTPVEFESSESRLEAIRIKKTPACADCRQKKRGCRHRVPIENCKNTTVASAKKPSKAVTQSSYPAVQSPQTQPEQTLNPGTGEPNAATPKRSIPPSGVTHSIISQSTGSIRIDYPIQAHSTAPPNHIHIDPQLENYRPAMFKVLNPPSPMESKPIEHDRDPADDKPDGDKPDEDKLYEHSLAENMTAENQPLGNQPDQHQTTENPPIADEPAKNKTAMNEPAKNELAMDEPTKDIPAEKMLASASSVPTEEISTENKPTSASSVPTEESSTENKPSSAQSVRPAGEPMEWISNDDTPIIGPPLSEPKPKPNQLPEPHAVPIQKSAESLGNLQVEQIIPLPAVPDHVMSTPGKTCDLAAEIERNDSHRSNGSPSSDKTIKHIDTINAYIQNLSHSEAFTSPITKAQSPPKSQTTSPKAREIAVSIGAAPKSAPTASVVAPDTGKAAPVPPTYFPQSVDPSSVPPTNWPSLSRVHENAQPLRTPNVASGSLKTKAVPVLQPGKSQSAPRVGKKKLSISILDETFLPTSDTQARLSDAFAHEPPFHAKIGNACKLLVYLRDTGALVFDDTRSQIHTQNFNNLRSHFESIISYESERLRLMSLFCGLCFAFPYTDRLKRALENWRDSNTPSVLSWVEKFDTLVRKRCTNFVGTEVNAKNDKLIPGLVPFAFPSAALFYWAKFAALKSMTYECLIQRPEFAMLYLTPEMIVEARRGFNVGMEAIRQRSETLGMSTENFFEANNIEGVWADIVKEKQPLCSTYGNAIDGPFGKKDIEDWLASFRAVRAENGFADQDLMDLD